MEYRPLGRTGVQVSPLCLGAMMFGPWGNDDRADAIRIIHRALDAGINFVDTADVYSGGVSEEIVGEALAGRRDDVVLATKFFMPMSEDPNQRGGSRRWIMRAVENSLRRLNTDYIDLYQVHRPSPDTDVEETLGALTDLVRQGKVRYIGSSSYSGSRSWKPSGHPVSATWNGSSPSSRPYSILVRGIEEDVLPTAQRHGMGTLTYSPLSGGWLSGRWRKDAASAPTSACPPERPVRHDKPGQPAQTRHRRRTRPARRAGRTDPHRARHRVRDQPPRRHRRDHRTAHHGTARVLPSGRRHHLVQRRSGPHRPARRARA